VTDKILSIDEVTKLVSLSKRTIYTEVSEGRFPRQVQISRRRVGWKESAIRQWLDARGQVA